MEGFIFSRKSKKYFGRAPVTREVRCATVGSHTPECEHPMKSVRNMRRVRNPGHYSRFQYWKIDFTPDYHTICRLSTLVGSGWAIISPPTYFFILWKFVSFSPCGECDSLSKSDFENSREKDPFERVFFYGSGELLSPTYLCLFHLT